MNINEVLKSDYDLCCKELKKATKKIEKQEHEIERLNNRIDKALKYYDNRVKWYIEHDYQKIGIHNVINLLGTFEDILKGSDSNDNNSNNN